MSLPSPGMRPRAGGAPAAAPLIVTDGQPGDRVRSRLPAGAGAETPEGKLILQTVLLPSVPMTIGAVAFSVILGVGFGMYPAVKASGLQPVDALRAD